MTLASSAAPSGAVASTASTTVTSGAPVAASPTAPATSAAAASTAQPDKPKTFKDRMLAALTGRRADQAKAAQAPAEGESPDAPGDAEVPGGELKDKPEESKDDEKTVPMKAFQERIGRLNDQKRELAQQISAKDLELSRRDAAIEMIAEENQRLLKALREGTAFDERDETIREHELANRARARAGEIQQLADAAARESLEGEAQAEVSRSVREEVSTALASHPLLHRAELVAACKLKENLDRSAAEVAASLEADKLAIARTRLAPEKPRAPTTVKAAGGGNGSHRFTNNAKGMTALLAARRQAHQ